MCLSVLCHLSLSLCLSVNLSVHAVTSFSVVVLIPFVYLAVCVCSFPSLSIFPRLPVCLSPYVCLPLFVLSFLPSRFLYFSDFYLSSSVSICSVHLPASHYMLATLHVYLFVYSRQSFSPFLSVCPSLSLPAHVSKSPIFSIRPVLAPLVSPSLFCRFAYKVLKPRIGFSSNGIKGICCVFLFLLLSHNGANVRL